MFNSITDILNKKDIVISEPYINGRIVEYDIKSANISILKKNRVIDDNYYEYLSKLPKVDREVEIGNLIRGDNQIYNIIQEGINNTIKKFIEINNVSLNSIVRRANDALYINTPIDLIYTNIDGIIIRIKNIYNYFLQLKDILFFFYYDSNNNINVDIKGISKEKVELHNGYMITVIGTTILLLERSSPLDALEYLNKFIEDYIKREIDIGYYRNLNSGSEYNYNVLSSSFNIMNDLNNKENINIEYNLSILRDLYNIIFSIYIKNK